MNTSTPDHLFRISPDEAPVKVPADFLLSIKQDTVPSDVVFADLVYDEESEVLTVTAGSERSKRFFLTGPFALTDVDDDGPWGASSTRRLVRLLYLVVCDDGFTERDAWDIAYKLTKGKTVRIAARW